MSVVLRPVPNPDPGPDRNPGPDCNPGPRPVFRSQPSPGDTVDRQTVDRQTVDRQTVDRQTVDRETWGRETQGRVPDAAGDEASSTPSESIRVVLWPDPVIDRLGYDPRSLYVETFWLGILGPTSTWLIRRFAAGLDEEPSGFDLDVDDTARALGLGGRSGRHSPFRRALARCVTFEVARRQGPATLAVRRKLPPLPRRHLQRLPTSLQDRHARWMTASRRSPLLDDARRHSRRLALGLLESGESPRAVEIQLVRWRVHPALAHEATQWAMRMRTDGIRGAAAREQGATETRDAHGTVRP